MKNMINIVYVLILITLIIGCFDSKKSDNEEIKLKKIVLISDKTEIKADNTDMVTFTVKGYDQNEQEIDADIKLYKDDSEINGKNFKTEIPGEYKFLAKKDEILSNTIVIKVKKITPIYVTLAGHIEGEAYYANKDKYLFYRDKLLKFAELVKKYNVPFNLQIDYEFFIGVTKFETEEVKYSTGGKNIIDYIVENHNFQIDPHQNGGYEDEKAMENYADVRYIGGMATGTITDTVGGIIWNQNEQFERLNNGEKGKIYSDFIWYPKVITMGVHFDHHNGRFEDDDLTSGIWQPKGFGEDFLIHAQENRMIYIAPGMQHSDWAKTGKFPFSTAVEYIELLIRYLEQGKIPENKIYTCTLAVPQGLMFNEADFTKLTAQLDILSSYVSSGKVVFINYENLVNIWKNEYNSEPNIFTFDKIAPADYTNK